jgi:hypothetical protein
LRANAAAFSDVACKLGITVAASVNPAALISPHCGHVLLSHAPVRDEMIMSEANYFGAVPFERDEDGGVVLGQPREAKSEIAARCMAAAMAATQSGAMAFSRRDDSSAPGAGTITIIGHYGDAPADMRVLEDA